jgi:predicted nucleic acid-binding Zn ribbon protein
MIPVCDVVPEAVMAILRKAPLTPEKVEFAWRRTVGPAVAHATSVTWREGVLYVRARDGAWQREVERSAATVRARLDAILGDGAVRYIKVRQEGG